MDYYINPSTFASVFPVPTNVADNLLKLAKGDHIKILLYIMRNSTSSPTVEEISSATDVSEYDVREGLLYWADAGVLMPINATPQKPENKKSIRAVSKPTRSEIIKLAQDNPKIRYLLNETQIKFARNLKQNETETLVWLHEDMGLDISLILFAVQYAVTQDKKNIRFIEKLLLEWDEEGIQTVSEADEEIRDKAVLNQAFGIVCSAFGIERRKPSKKELQLSALWILEWGFSREMLNLAYDICVNNNSKFSFAYIAKILENWHSKGYKTPKDVGNAKDDSTSKNGASYDLDLFEKMINSKD